MKEIRKQKVKRRKRNRSKKKEKNSPPGPKPSPSPLPRRTGILSLFFFFSPADSGTHLSGHAIIFLLALISPETESPAVNSPPLQYPLIPAQFVASPRL
jgi:hypothetical protein